MTITHRAAALLICLIAQTASPVLADNLVPISPPSEWFRPPETRPAEGFSAEGLEAVFFDAAPWNGKPTRTFAWIGMPKVEPGRKVPGIVLVHGGGGTAFADWVKLWNRRGYAAIAMDTCGTVPRGTYAHWDRHPEGGPPGNDFRGADGPVQDQWPYHAVADVVRAHSLLRERPGVDPERIGLTGISWGGYLTCLVSGLDTRFKFAAPVYGCGFLGEASAWKGELDGLGETGRRWLSLWDPSHYLPSGAMPKLWVSGTNDFAYPLDSLRKSARIAGGRSTYCIRLRMPHGHGAAGENPEEIHAFANSVVNGGPPLVEVEATERQGDLVRVHYRSSQPLARAELLWTRDQGSWTGRLWESSEMRLDDLRVPRAAKAYFVNLVDDQGRVISTEVESAADSAP